MELTSTFFTLQRLIGPSPSPNFKSTYIKQGFVEPGVNPTRFGIGSYLKQEPRSTCMSGYGLQSIPRSRMLSYREVSYQGLIKMEDDGEQRFKEA